MLQFKKPAQYIVDDRFERNYTFHGTTLPGHYHLQSILKVKQIKHLLLKFILY